MSTMSDLITRAGGRPATPPTATTLHLVDVAPVLDAIAELAAEVKALCAEVVARRESSRPEAMMTRAQVAELLQVSRRSVAAWVSDGLFLQARDGGVAEAQDAAGDAPRSTRGSRSTRSDPDSREP